eukprot:TRINITY_DN1055_c0_g2_i1.p1 TRINITY_DN1055_c0_g2~~TRINITY_DN1055_c0_g2_i1.p1  ORF type:complete len:285 (-),score=63.63 TRINITY_DN1055_c0_g2_i1:63-917(-)
MMMRASLLVVVALSVVAVSVAAVVSPPPFRRIVNVIFENEDSATVLANPYMMSLASRGLYLSHFDAITHPSQPNYIAMTSGDLHGVTDDNMHNVSARHIADLLDAKGVSWGSYAQDFPGKCYQGMTQGRYVRRHVPFLSYDNVRLNASRCAKIVNADNFWPDFTNNKLPEFVFYTPNLDNDGHDTGVDYAASWLKTFIEPLLANPSFMNGTLIVLTHDENHDYDLENTIYTTLIADRIKAGRKDDTKYTLYDLLRMWEDNWDLGTLGMGDAKAQGHLLQSALMG